MGLFGPDLPNRVTKEEFEQIKNRLYGELDEMERAQVEMLFHGHLHESGEQSGITQSEFDSAIAWLEGNRSKHVLESGDIEKLKKYFAEHLQD